MKHLNFGYLLICNHEKENKELNFNGNVKAAGWRIKKSTCKVHFLVNIRYRIARAIWSLVSYHSSGNLKS